MKVPEKKFWIKEPKLVIFLFVEKWDLNFK